MVNSCILVHFHCIKHYYKTSVIINYRYEVKFYLTDLQVHERGLDYSNDFLFSIGTYNVQMFPMQHFFSRFRAERE